MSRVYTDKELKIVSQLAYCNLDSEIYETLKGERSDGAPVSLRELFQKEKENHEKNGSEYDLYYVYSYIENDTFTNSELMRKDIESMIDDIIDGKICQGWKILDIKNDENGSGMYAVTLDTGNNNAIVGYRGSEHNTNGVTSGLHQFLTDWIFADGGIACGEMTMQEIVAGKYLDTIGEKYKDYSFATTGHHF